MRDQEKTGPVDLRVQLQCLSAQGLVPLRVGWQSAYCLVQSFELRPARVKSGYRGAVARPEPFDRIDYCRTELQSGVAGLGSVIREYATPNVRKAKPPRKAGLISRLFRIKNYAAKWCVRRIEMSPSLPNRDVTIVVVGRRAGAEPRRSAAPARRPMHRPTKPLPLFDRARSAYT